MTAVSADYTAAPPASSRHSALVDAASRIRAGGRQLPVERILLVAASIFFPLGLILIFLGWEGAAHNGHPYAQMSYLISGGILGLALSVVGGFLYFGYWLSRQLGESRRQHGLTLLALGRMEDLLDAALNSSLAPAPAPSLPLSAFAPPVTPAVNGPAALEAAVVSTNGKGTGRRKTARTRAAAASADVDATGEVPVATGAVLYATPRGSLLHRPECPVVARREDLQAVAPGTAGYGYCTMCDAAAVVA